MCHDANELYPLHLANGTGTANVGQAQQRVAVLTEDTASCLDLDQTGGQPRYYGPASRLYIHESRHTVQASAELETDRDFKIDIESPQIHKQLLFLFWHVQVLPAAAVDEDLFRAGRTAGVRSQYYSEFLQNTLLACASRSSTSSSMRALGEKYIERAKKDIAREIERPNLASLQGFLLLSDFEATQGRDRAGWIYCGTACRLMFDLGLHEDCSNLVRQGRLTVEDASMRLNAFLVTFIFEKFWKLYLGRPSSVDEASLNAVRNSTKGMAVNPIVDAYVCLCVHVSSITDLLNSSASMTSISEVRVRTAELDAQLQRWYNELPTSLKDGGLERADMDLSAYGINMQICGIRIALHRMLSRLESEYHGRNASETHLDSERNPTSSNGIIHDNAVQIAKLIRTYREIFGVDRVATIMLDNMYIAAQALIQRIVWLETRDMPHATDLCSLQILADTMKDVVPHYPVTARMRLTLARLVDSSTSMRGMFGQNFGRHITPTPLLTDDLNMTTGAWRTIDPFWNFDMTDSGYVDVEAIFSGD